MTGQKYEIALMLMLQVACEEEQESTRIRGRASTSVSPASPLCTPSRQCAGLGLAEGEALGARDGLALGDALGAVDGAAEGAPQPRTQLFGQ